MCHEQCTSFYNLPCFLLFRCTSKIKKFFLILILPIVFVIVMAVGCYTGLIDLECMCNAFMLISGITLIKWLLKKRRNEREGEEDRDEEGGGDQKNEPSQKGTPEEIDNGMESEKRLAKVTQEQTKPHA